MLPLNYAILKLFEAGDELDARQVMDRLQADYARFRAFKPAAVQESLMSAEKNDLLERSDFRLDQTGGLRVFYRVTDYGRTMVARYIRLPGRTRRDQPTTDISSSVS